MKIVTTKLKLADIYSRKDTNKIKSKYSLSGEVEFIRKGIMPANMDDIVFDEGEKSVIKIITTATMDRDREIVLPSGANLTHYQSNPVVLAGHDWSGLGVGKSLWIKSIRDGYALMQKTQYNINNAKGAEYYQWQKDGFPLASSIGFIPIKQCVKGTPEFDNTIVDLVNRGWLFKENADMAECVYPHWLLLEVSDVTIPSNPEAMMVAVSKSIKPKSANEGGIVIFESDDYSDSSDIVNKDAPAVTKPEPEETETEIRVRVQDPDLFETESFRHIEIKKDKPRVFAIIGRKKGGEKTEIQSYRFPLEDGWTAESARAWADEHPVKSLNDFIAIFDIPNEPADEKKSIKILPVKKRMIKFTRESINTVIAETVICEIDKLKIQSKMQTSELIAREIKLALGKVVYEDE